MYICILVSGKYPENPVIQHTLFYTWDIALFHPDWVAWCRCELVVVPGGEDNAIVIVEWIYGYCRGPYAYD